MVHGRNEARLAESVELIRAQGGEAMAVAGDVTVAADMERLVADTEAAFGPVDCVAAIAGGGGGYEAVDAIDPAGWASVIQLNLVGTFHTVRAVLPSMRERGRGTIVTACGGGAWFPMVGHTMTAYATAKAGLCRFTDQLAVELLDTDVRVNCMQPGKVLHPDRLREIEAEEERIGTPHPDREGNHPPEDGAELTAFLLSAESAPLSGRIASVDEDWWRDPARVAAVAADPHLACLRRVHP